MRQWTMSCTALSLMEGCLYDMEVMEEQSTCLGAVEGIARVYVHEGPCVSEQQPPGFHPLLGFKQLT